MSSPDRPTQVDRLCMSARCVLADGIARMRDSFEARHQFTPDVVHRLLHAWPESVAVLRLLVLALAIRVACRVAALPSFVVADGVGVSGLRLFGCGQIVVRLTTAATTVELFDLLSKGARAFVVRAVWCVIERDAMTPDEIASLIGAFVLIELGVFSEPVDLRELLALDGHVHLVRVGDLLRDTCGTSFFEAVSLRSERTQGFDDL